MRMLRLSTASVVIAMLWMLLLPAGATAQTLPSNVGARAESPAGSDVSIATLAPTCIARWIGTDWRGYYAKARNDCWTNTYNVKIIMVWSPDSSCTTLAPGQEMRIARTWYGRIDRVELC
jgi:hypothetical protein